MRPTERTALISHHRYVKEGWRDTETFPALALSESLMPPMVAQNMTPQEIVYAAARSAGFATAHIKIHGLGDLWCTPLHLIDGVRR